LCCAKVVDSGVQTHVGLHVHATSQVGHDLVDAGFEVFPSVELVSAANSP
jgi:hypothetical protein